MKNPDGVRAKHLELGKEGEEAAAAYLLANNFQILDRNWRHGKLELDLVCMENGAIVFVEVKTRAAASFGGPEGAITRAKKTRLLKCAMHWLSAKKAWNYPARFDVLCLVGSGKNLSMEHYRNAFDFSQALDNRNPTWQSW